MLFCCCRISVFILFLVIIIFFYIVFCFKCCTTKFTNKYTYLSNYLSLRQFGGRTMSSTWAVGRVAFSTRLCGFYHLGLGHHGLISIQDLNLLELNRLNPEHKHGCMQRLSDSELRSFWTHGTDPAYRRGWVHLFSHLGLETWDD